MKSPLSHADRIAIKLCISFTPIPVHPHLLGRLKSNSLDKLCHIITAIILLTLQNDTTLESHLTWRSDGSQSKQLHVSKDFCDLTSNLRILVNRTYVGLCQLLYTACVGVITRCDVLMGLFIGIRNTYIRTYIDCNEIYGLEIKKPLI